MVAEQLGWQSLNRYQQPAIDTVVYHHHHHHHHQNKKKVSGVRSEILIKDKENQMDPYRKGFAHSSKGKQSFWQRGMVFLFRRPHINLLPPSSETDRPVFSFSEKKTARETKLP